MKKLHTKKVTAQKRRTVTLIVSALAVVLSGSTFVMMMLRVTNMHVVFYLTLGLSILIIAYLLIWTLAAGEKHKRLAIILRRCYLICFAIGVAFFIILQGLIISGAKTDGTEADCLIVLGAGLRSDAPSLILRTRLNKAAEYLLSHEEVPVIVSGGLGRGETVTEAEAMSRYLIARGIGENRIWKEELSTSTQENLLFSLGLMEEKGLDVDNAKVIIVSNEFHLYRAKLIASKAGLDASGMAAQTPGLFLRVLYSGREAFALAAEIVFR